MTIKVEITADTADGLAEQLNEFVQTFVQLARTTGPTPFDGDKPAELVTPKPAPAEEDAKPRKRRTAPVIDASAEPAKANGKGEPEEATPEAVRAVLNKLRTEKGNEALGKVVTMFAPKFSEIPETSYPKLFAEAKKALAA